MGWFNDQIESRKRADRESFEDSCRRIADAVMGKKLTAALNDSLSQTTDAIGEILHYYHVKEREVPDTAKTIDEVLEVLLRPSGMMTREVLLTDGWSRDATGAMLTTFEKDGRAVALIPIGMMGYKYLDPLTGKYVRVKHGNESLFSDSAIAFYVPFPQKKLGVKELFGYIVYNIDRRALQGYGLFALVATLTGMLIPVLSESLFSDVLPSKSISALTALAVFMISASIGNLLFGTVQSLYLQKMTMGLSQRVESATIMRILSLPGEVFKQYSSGDLASRLNYMPMLVEAMISMLFSSFMSVLFSLIYVFQIRNYTPALAKPALLVTLLTVVINIAAISVRSRVNSRQMELQAKESGLSFAFVSGVEKIRLAGAERRAFAQWGNSYAAHAKLLYDPPFFVKVSGALSKAIPLIGAVFLYFAALHSDVSVADYYAFNSAYGMILGTLTALELIVAPSAQIKPILEMLRPITESVPEVSEDKPVIDKVTGAIELSNVTFRYADDMPAVLDNISLKIRPGQYVAVTGKTGCGKSTLMRILLGFEKPQKGSVYYDGRDLNSIDLKSLRSKIGTVMQNGQIFSGDIYSNIVISAPQLTLDDAWEAAEKAGMAESIREMPMGMHTMISEGSGGISGGQKQRLMIARAIAPKPKILMFDEATSALDNITQKMVSDSLDALKCTRIVIAHRLSTIQHCDRIIVLDGGKIAEDGTYEELIQKGGVFAELVERQRVDA